jgi:predicted dehydrogenase
VSKPLKAAIIGTNIGCTLHIRALKTAGFDVTTLVGRDPERTAIRAAHFGVPLATTRVEAVIDSDADVVVITTPPTSHASIAIPAMEAGKHILCEKPLASTSGLGREMVEAAKSTGVVTALQHQYRWEPEYAMMRRIVRGGDLGELLQAVFTFDFCMTNKPGPLDVPEWWFTAETGGGWLRNWNSHGIDLIRYIIGEFGAVTGRLHPDLPRGMSADDGYVTSFVLKNGMQGSMTGSCRAWDTELRFRILGDKGTAMVDQVAPNSGSPLRVADARGIREVHAPEDLLSDLRGGLPLGSRPAEVLPDLGDGRYQEVHMKDTYYVSQVGLCTAFRRMIEDRSYSNPAIATFEDGLRTFKVIEAVERANRENRWVELE